MQHRERILEHQRHAAGEPRRARIPQRFHFATQRRLPFQKDDFDRPALAIQFRHFRGGRFARGQIGENVEDVIAVARRRFQFDRDATNRSRSPFMAWAVRVFRLKSVWLPVQSRAVVPR